MSTFDGIVEEFPDIRVDFFRSSPGRRPPLACFLSHVHSDHLAGLESLRSPFVYCSAATREMLLRLERYPCRINYAKGILESRVQTYKHLNSLLKPIPLEAPTTLELEPGRSLRVTLFDANHCTGAVMFLFEGDGKAVLYTGDIRGEPWHVNALARSPCLVEYSSGVNTLDKIYLDTSFTDDVTFPPKADGIRELLRKVAQYPKDTIFHFQAWTFGYEDVWIALSKTLDSKIHVDSYKLELYGSLVAKGSKDRYGAQFHMGAEAPALVGFMCGNTQHPGCLTSDESVRLHSCEKGNRCPTVRSSRVVRIVPVIARLPDGSELAEAGVGGGWDDLEREAELDLFSVQAFLEILTGDPDIPMDVKAKIKEVLENAATTGRNATLDLDISTFGSNNEADLGSALKGIANSLSPGSREARKAPDMPGSAGSLPRTITFPYARHSSYQELCHFLQAFRPKDVWPCAAHPAEWVQNGISIRGLFGHCCSGDAFEYDQRLAEIASRIRIKNTETQETQTTRTSADYSVDEPECKLPAVITDDASVNSFAGADAAAAADEAQVTSPRHARGQKRTFADYARCAFAGHGRDDEEDALLHDSQESTISDTALDLRRAAFNAVFENEARDEHRPIGLISVTDNHSRPEIELGGPYRP